MKTSSHIESFLRREDGSLLVFFMVSAITVLGIVALSFDLGRRASTQTDMQAFVDNVVLAAAGELDGSELAIDNATRAANLVIDAANERLKAGTAGQEITIALDQIVFYEDLPDRDAPRSLDPADLSNPSSLSYKYRLPRSDLGPAPDPLRARYVGVRLATVDVPWMFAGIFSASDLPDEAVGAIAIAGNTAWTCDIAPVLFCLPEDDAGEPEQLGGGIAMNLRSAGQFSRWRTGDFGFARVGIDPSGACAGLTDEAGRQACLITARQEMASCFQPGRTNVEPGLRAAQESAAFNMSFDIFQESMIQFSNEGFYAPGPHSVSGRVWTIDGDQCFRPDASPDTMAFPLDDCHATASCADGRLGDGEWSDGREEYVETNYTIYDAPFDPDNPTAPRTVVVDGDFFDFPETSLTRYQFYLREIERARAGGVMATLFGMPEYSGARYRFDNDGDGEIAPDGVGASPPYYSTWDDYWPDSYTRLNPIIPTAHGRQDDGLPQCNLNEDVSPEAERRVLLAGGIHCPRRGNTVVGYDENVRIVDFYRVFQLSPTEETFPGFNLNVEIIERLELEDVGPVREVVQLFR